MSRRAPAADAVLRARPSAVGLALLAALPASLAGCMQPAPLPNPGPCADVPEGVYEYGQIFIGTCLSTPADVELLAGGSVLAVSNADVFGDFTGGSALFLDLDRLDLSVGRNLVSDLAIAAIDLPAFAGDMAFSPSQGVLAITNRNSEGARTREATDYVHLVDVSDPRAPVLAEVGVDGASTVAVGYDPTAIVVSEAAGTALVVNRTSHDVSLVDLRARPVAVVPPGGEGRLEPGAFVDAAGDGGNAGFVVLDPSEEPATTLTDSSWSARWSIGAVRLWIPSGTGARRVEGNGAGTWQASAVPLDVDAADTDGVIAGIADPSLLLETSGTASVARLIFADTGSGAVRAALADDVLFDWAFEADPLLSPRSDAWDEALRAPQMVKDGEAWWLFYTGEGADGTGIGIAKSGDGVAFMRVSDAPVLDGASDATVLYDAQATQWRMYYRDADGALALAVSDDLETWTAQGAMLSAAGGVYGPEVAWWNGAFHAVYTTATADGWALAGARSVDGERWDEEAVDAALSADEAASAEAPTVAMYAWPEEAFRFADASGDLFGLPVAPGDTVENPVAGWQLRVAVGQAAEPATVGAATASIGGWFDEVAYVALADEDGGAWIGAATLDANGFLAIDPVPLLTADDADADSVASPIVFGAADGSLVMLFSRTVGDTTSIARATSADGLTWVVGDDVLVAAEDWESVALEPGSVKSADGALTLWYSASDGSRWRIGAAESVDEGVSFARLPGAEEPWIFDGGAPGEWDDSGARDPFVHVGADGATWLWYAGFDGAQLAVGLAEIEADGALARVTDATGAPRAVLSPGPYGFGIEGLRRPIVREEADGRIDLWYAGEDATALRPGRAIASSGTPDRVHRVLAMPAPEDTLGFLSIPESDATSITLDTTIDGASLTGLGCGAVALDDVRGFAYVACKLEPWIYVLDVRDDGVAGDPDLNYLDVEAVVLLETSTNFNASAGLGSGARGLLVDAARGWLWGTADEPEALYAIDVSGVEDDDTAEIIRDPIAAMLPLPRSGARDQGVDTQSLVGPAALALHPDGRHLFVTNFNSNSLSVFDLATGAPATQIGEVRDLGENPYALAVSPDGSRAYVAHYLGEVDGAAVSSTIAVLDADPSSTGFLDVLTWVVNK